MKKCLSIILALLFSFCLIGVSFAQQAPTTPPAAEETATPEKAAPKKKAKKAKKPKKSKKPKKKATDEAPAEEAK